MTQSMYPGVCDGILVIGIGGADEVVVRDEGFGGELLEDGSTLIAEQFGFDSGFGRCLLDLQSMLIGSRAHDGILASERSPALEDICDDQRVEVTDVWGYHSVNWASFSEARKGRRRSAPALT